MIGHADGFSLRLLACLRAHTGLIVGDNEPYRMDETDFSIPHHAFAGGLPYAEIEVRQDLLLTDDDVAHWASLVAGALEDSA